MSSNLTLELACAWRTCFLATRWTSRMAQTSLPEAQQARRSEPVARKSCVLGSAPIEPTVTGSAAEMQPSVTADALAAGLMSTTPRERVERPVAPNAA